MIDRWDHLELTRSHLEAQGHRIDLTLDGERPPAENADRIVATLRDRT